MMALMYRMIFFMVPPPLPKHYINWNGVCLMEKKLPQAFVDKMQRLLGDEFADFAASFGKPRHYGLRLNPLKVSAGDYMKQNPFGLTPVPWAAVGFYYDGDKRPGKHPHYYAGLYYIQEPSAMAPVE